MKAILTFLMLVVLPGPKESLKLASWMVADSRQEQRELYQELKHIAVRESSLRPVGVHENDRHATDEMYKKAKEARWLSESCPRQGMEVRGILGLSVPYNLRWLGLRCAPPWIFDIPLVSAFAGARKHKSRCWKYIRNESVYDPVTQKPQVIKVLNPLGANGWCR